MVLWVLILIITIIVWLIISPCFGAIGKWVNRIISKIFNNNEGEK